MKDNDEFADFTSAFKNVTISNPLSKPQLPQSQINLMGVAIPPVNNSTVNNMSINNAVQTAGTTALSVTPVIQNSNESSDLFDSLSPQGLSNQITNNNTGNIIY